jgi:hypothetical protein
MSKESVSDRKTHPYPSREGMLPHRARLSATHYSNRTFQIFDTQRTSQEKEVHSNKSLSIINLLEDCMSNSIPSLEGRNSGRFLIKRPGVGYP